MRHAQLAAAALCLLIASPALADPVDIVVVPDPDVRINAVRVAQQGAELEIAAHVGWAAPALSRKPDYLRVEAYAAGNCVGSTVSAWTPSTRLPRMSQRAFRATLRLDNVVADEVRIVRASASAPASGCAAAQSGS